MNAKYISNTETPDKLSLLRITVALMMVIPAITLFIVYFIAVPDLEMWLLHKTKELARPDAYDGLSRVAPAFLMCLFFTSLLASALVVLRKSSYLIPPSVGPVIGLLIYLFTHGLTDPSWFAMAALLTIGMLVGTPVTAAWAMFCRERSYVPRRPITMS